MAVIKIADEPLSSSLKKKSARPSSDLKKTKSCDCNACLKRTIRVIMMCLLVTHTIWDFIETLTAMTIDFTVNHEQGRDGFTLLENLRIIEITEWEHRSWELPGEIEFHDKGNKEDAKMLATRVKLIAKCSKLKITAENNHTQCNNASKEFQEDNYFCAG
ncbi:uncharacterized protein LOC118435401 [Folsomia candida]|uniref:uncharacterized protein LOC118435401 n=1 Tax=Folsomia candida TaxID=158441 RepID=UPI001604AC2A|nr:uncharacterized protein LOC118435401 [Folsomia candida]